MARNDRLARLLGLADLLMRSRRGVVLSAVAERHGWKLRSLYRDIEAMEKAGWPIAHEGSRYVLMEGWMSALQLGIDPDELRALFAARELCAGLRGTSLAASLDRLWGKLTHATGRQPALIPVEEAPWFALRAPFSIDYNAHRATIAALERAVREKLAVVVEYQAASTGELAERVIEPGELYWDPSLESLYAIAYCRLRADVRVFAVHRFRRVEVTKERFGSRPETSSGAALRNAFRVWHGATVERVTIRFDRSVAQEILERRWHSTQSTERLPDGGVLFQCEVAGLDEIRRFVLGYGGAACVLAPARLAQAVRGELERAMAHYATAAEREAPQASDAPVHPGLARATPRTPDAPARPGLVRATPRSPDAPAQAGASGPSGGRPPST